MRTVLVLLLTVCACAASAQPREDEVKAAFLYKFLSFVEFPRAALPHGAPVVIGVAGADEVAAELAQLVVGRSVEGRPVQVRRLREGEAAEGVHVLFLARGQAGRLRELQRNAPAQPLLLVADWEGALDAGAVVNFVRAEARVRFEVALDAAERRGLRISPRMLAVAQSVRPARL